MLDGCLSASGLQGAFDHVLSTDTARTFKPDPRAYQLGVKAFRRPASQILFVAFAGWDAAGAKAFGYPTYWMNRSGQTAERLGVEADATGPNMAGLLRFLAVA